jgi:hypothetical protein
MKPNRRKFITPEGEIIRTWFDAYWYTIDKDGDRYIYGEGPKPEIKTCRMVWLTGSFIVQRCGKQTGDFDFKTCRWYLSDSGKWVRK